ncbi:hypothetical protein J2Z79_001837 [Symbiobacterium terraclitae]|jgi:hypothetical protein|uniref:Uncharacterized protein n=1 Tax=Symbiobacterium terraclitae TaxID=557451 RepID=A0ABS4JTX8_9FIRM|nr:hypothetical protein [Symbiobacterium terraclitae]MBP2018426.1 hypothetical protein [Symbiobacterium terraclitae]
MKKPDVDERTVAVDNAAGNLGYRVMAWLLVADLAVHGLWPDLVSLRGFPLDIPVILGAGWLAWIWCRVRDDTISRHRFVIILSSFGLAGAMAVGFALLRR